MQEKRRKIILSTRQDLTPNEFIERAEREGIELEKGAVITNEYLAKYLTDGKFTLADRAWAELIFFASTNIWGDFHELVPLTEEQLRQCDLIPDESWKDILTMRIHSWA